MTTTKPVREITPLTQIDCFVIFKRLKQRFEFPIHYHDAYELNLILNAKGAMRVVGGSIEIIDELELVLVGPNLSHGWFTNQCMSEVITEVTIQFPKDLFGEKFLKGNQLSFLKSMLERSQKGIVFAPEIIITLKDRILELNKKAGLDSVLELLSILHNLSISRNMKMLTDFGFRNDFFYNSNTHIEKVLEYMNNNYNRQITLAEVARISNMPESSFSRFIKRCTGKTFIDSLNEIRIGHASKMLVDSNTTIAEIASNCGFNNISNFNRIFKRKKLRAPREFREAYRGKMVFV